ncbi:MAG: hypothetical protein HAW63_05925 [Bdellovibrionaceae bacterium]|nr:hypothetical protein [Pseudobdellovibrionaceae bacterium]
MHFLYRRKSSWLLGLIVLLISSTTKAYVPSVKGLAQLVTAQHGKGIYQVQQKVFFSDNKYTLYETWYIKDNLIKLKSSYKNTFSVYSTNKKQVWQESKYFIAPVGEYFYQNFFFSKNSSRFFKAAKKIKLSVSKSFSHLLRYNGNPQYIINNLSNISQTKVPAKYGPNIIIDNLRFYIKQILFKTNIFLQASNYKRYTKGLWLPKNIQVFFNKQSVTISTIKVKSISSYQFNQAKPKNETPKEVAVFNKGSDSLLFFLKHFR